MSRAVVRTTLTLPADLVERIDRAVHEGRALSRNALITTALRRELALMEAAAIDAALLEMAQDADYQAEALALAEAIGAAEWHAWRSAEAKS